MQVMLTKPYTKTTISKARRKLSLSLSILVQTHSSPLYCPIYLLWVDHIHNRLSSPQPTTETNVSHFGRHLSPAFSPHIGSFHQRAEPADLPSQAYVWSDMAGLMTSPTCKYRLKGRLEAAAAIAEGISSELAISSLHLLLDACSLLLSHYLILWMKAYHCFSSDHYQPEL